MKEQRDKELASQVQVIMGGVTTPINCSARYY